MFPSGGLQVNQYKILTYYCYTDIENPAREVKRHHRALKNLDAAARIYIADNGINAQMSLAAKDVDAYIGWLKSDTRFADVMVKIDSYHEHTFPRVTIKARKQLIALDAMPDLKKRGEHVPPEEWKKMLEERDENTLVIDVRNDYESAIGHFEGAERPPLKTFREFPAYAEHLAKVADQKKTKVMMYCTGGIRCETYSALLKEKGFDQVYQLEGGVINYGHKMGSQKWRGKLFVFDDRLSVPLQEGEEGEIISYCHKCQTLSATYYNCANMDCNKLFLSCPSCSSNLKGCCSKECTQAKRVRPFEQAERPKPFRKWYKYLSRRPSDDAECGCSS